MFEQELTLGLIVGAALLDSINPCVFGVLIFLVAYLFSVYKDPKRMLIAGGVYILAVYITYFLLGLGILRITTSLAVTRIFYFVAASVAIVAGLLEVKDFFWYGKGFSLQLLPGADKRIKFYTAQIAKMEKRHPLFSLAIAFILGIFVVLVELPCTGAPYLAILALIAQGAYSKAVPLLLLYNLVFILPLLAILGLAFVGKSVEGMEEWRRRHRGLMRLAVGIFLIALGLFMLYWIKRF
jgi:cytochrome c biogenesis protein CcdA